MGRTAWPYSDTLKWKDHLGVEHLLTIWADSIEQLVDDEKRIMGLIKASREQHQSSRTESPSAESKGTEHQGEDVQRCQIHGIDMPRRISRRTGGSYFSHVLSDNSLCYGRPKRA